MATVPTLVQTLFASAFSTYNGTNNTVAPAQINITTPTTAGNYIVAIIIDQSYTPTSVIDSVGNSYILKGVFTAGSPNNSILSVYAGWCTTAIPVGGWIKYT